MTWPEPPAGGPLGDGRFAHETDRPASVDDLRQAVIDRVAQGHAIYPQGGATALDHGGAPRRPGVAVDTRSLARVIDYPHADMTITVEAGITFEALGACLAEQNQRLLIDAPHPDRATVGGVFATNTCGPRRFGLGRPRDQVLGVAFVTSDGSLVRGGGRVVKNVAGYDFPRLLTGSMGTLGVIVEVTLKVRPRPEVSTLAWAVLDDLAALGPMLDRLNRSDTRPVAVEVLNPPAARRLGAPHGLPADGLAVVVGYEDNRTSVAWQLDRLKTELGRPALDVREGAEAAPLWRALTEFQSAEVGPVTLVANLRPSGVAGLLAEINPELWAVQAHAGNGIVRAHAAAGSGLDDLAPEVDRLRALAVRDGGNLVLARCPTAWKERLRVWGEPRADWAVCERIKQALDPLGVMNPGRFVGNI